ncbi:hypothetical protein [Prosthecobacter sp.]|uniref:hypothetical protein n=1 Tax=Prosthecobacter sp. TaxID=1965333 RepID=UPI003784D971
MPARALDYLPPTDPTVILLTEAIAFVRQWDFIANHPEVPVTPRQIEELKKHREDWIERANRWARNKPEYQAASQRQASSQVPDLSNLRQPSFLPCCQ